MKERPILSIVVPCYNEELVLPSTYNSFVRKTEELVNGGKIDGRSFVLFADDGSSDSTWRIIKSLSQQSNLIRGISLSRNRGHQNALLAGLLEVSGMVDVAVSMDCDGQQDINAIDEMLARYDEGFDVVYGVRKARDTDSFFKRNTALMFYKLMHVLGVEVVTNHADYRLLSSRVLDALRDYKEVNLFLRGLFPLIGFKSSIVYFDVTARAAGQSHYTVSRMLNFAIDGITSLSIKPLRLISCLGLMISAFSFFCMAYCLCVWFYGKVVPGWTSVAVVVSFMGGVQMLSLGIIGEYVGKTYLEVKRRPRFIVSERCGHESS